MKNDKAEINKFITALEDVRKQKKKEYLAPYEVFEGQKGRLKKHSCHLERRYL